MIDHTFIIIVTYNGMKWLSTCLNSCVATKVIIVDNNSTDGTVPFIQKHFPEIILLQQDHNIGFGAANNIGISYALSKGADYVFLLNQDAYLEANTVLDLIKIHQKNGDYGILSPIHLNGAGTKMDLNFSEYIHVNKLFQYDTLKNSYDKELYEVPFINAAAWLLPRKTLETIGGFDPIFFHLAEDHNYCQRVLYHQLKIGVAPEVFAFHDREFRPKRKPRNTAEKLERLERIYKKRWGNINIEIERNVIKTKLTLIKNIIKSFLLLNFRKGYFTMNTYRLITHILPKIKKSREKNKVVGLNYLEK